MSAAREGLGSDGLLMIDAGTVWRDDVSQARARLPALVENDVYWLEEPFVGEALSASRQLAESGDVPIAGGEGAFNVHMARHLMDYGKVSFIQIDTGRTGGIGPSRAVAGYAASAGVCFVNHTFTTHLALSALLAPFAGRPQWSVCEYPVEATPLAVDPYHHELAPGPDGLVRLPDAPGLGVEPNIETIRRSLVEVEIRVAGRTLYSTPKV